MPMDPQDNTTTMAGTFEPHWTHGPRGSKAMTTWTIAGVVGAIIAIILVVFFIRRRRAPALPAYA